MTRTVLITGAAGFAGSFLVQHYLAEGWAVHGTHRGPVGSRQNETAMYHAVDLRDSTTVDAIVSRVRPDVVHHLAAQSSVRVSLDDPLDTISGNVQMQLNVLEAVAAHAPAARVLVAGSADEYGQVRADDNPVSETHELRPVTPYGISKVAQDLMGYQYTVTRGLRVVRVRPFVQVGPRRSDRFVAGSFARQAAEIEAGIRPAVIEVGNIDIERDITDVRDVVRAYAAIVECGEPGEAYNLGSGVPRTIRDLLMATLRAAGIQAEIRQDDSLQRAGEPVSLYSDSSKLQAATGWKPEIGFEQSAADTLDYWRERVTTGDEVPA
jgi:GDP-4-dehydro-6-deoxy-D-mannose reductase